MSALLHPSVASTKWNQVIRPMSPFDVVSTTQRLVLSSQGFATALEYAEAISRGLTEDFADALMAALGYATAMRA